MFDTIIRSDFQMHPNRTLLIIKRKARGAGAPASGSANTTNTVDSSPQRSTSQVLPTNSPLKETKGSQNKVSSAAEATKNPRRYRPGPRKTKRWSETDNEKEDITSLNLDEVSVVNISLPRGFSYMRIVFTIRRFLGKITTVGNLAVVSKYTFRYTRQRHLRLSVSNTCNSMCHFQQRIP